MATKVYRVTVFVEGREQKVQGPRTPDKAEAEGDLRKITEAQRRGSDAVVELPWLSVKERLIAAAFIEEAWSGTSLPKAGGRRYRTSLEP